MSNSSNFTVRRLYVAVTGSRIFTPRSFYAARLSKSSGKYYRHDMVAGKEHTALSRIFKNCTYENNL
jgi:hypothetical protein